MRILGLSALHDSSVAIVNDNKIEFFCKEERLTKKKRDLFPFKSFLLALETIKEKIDYICIATGKDIIIESFIKKYLNCPIIDYANKHHLCHASLAFYNSGFDKSLIFIIDRTGSLVGDVMREAETVFVATYPCNFYTHHKNYWMHCIGNNVDEYNEKIANDVKYQHSSISTDSVMSIVKVYESATSLIGQDPLENGKTMGLASYGKKQPFVNFFANGRPIDNLFCHGNFVDDSLPTTLFRGYHSKIEKNINISNYQFYADYAYQVQKQTQEHTLEFIKTWVEKTGIKNVCISGGYGLNVVANGYFSKNLPKVNFFFEPIADDTGNSIGAALHLCREKTKDKTVHKLKNLFFQGIKINLKDVGEDCTTNDIVDLLINQKTVAVFNGLAEAGPRALGNRSILFDARNKNAKKIINDIKNREWYRPFAGMVLKEDFDYYFETNGLKESEYMTVSFDVKRPELIPGIVHVDNTCRVQTVSNDVQHIYDVLKIFKQKTNCSVLLNTSFNLAGKPLVETQENAIETFNNSNLDALWFPEINKIIKKK